MDPLRSFVGNLDFRSNSVRILNQTGSFEVLVYLNNILCFGQREEGSGQIKGA